MIMLRALGSGFEKNIERNHYNDPAFRLRQDEGSYCLRSGGSLSLL